MSPVRPEDYDDIVAKINKKYDGDIRRGDDYEIVPRISTGSLSLDAAMGGGVPHGRWTRFYGGFHCVAPGSVVLTTDFEWVPIENLSAGDSIVGFDENTPGGSGRQRRFVESTVIDNPLKQLPSKRIITERGEVTASDEHLWLVRDCKGTYWKRSDNLSAGDKILWFDTPWGQVHGATRREAAAYLGGLFDGEGTVHKGRVHLYQNPGAVLDKAESALIDLGFQPLKYDNKECKRVTIDSTVASTMRFFSHIPTTRLADGAGSWWQGREITPKGPHKKPLESYAVVEVVEDVGVQDVYAIGTSSQTLMVNGFFSHNSSKTLTALSVAREAQELGLLVAYYNVEKQYDELFARVNIGLNPEELTLVEGATIEEIGEKMEALMTVCHVHIIDSCSIAVSEDELNADIRDWRPGLNSRAWGKVFRRLNERFDHVSNTVIMIDQMRTNFKTGGEQAAGGRVFDFQSSMSVLFKKGNWIFRNKEGFLDDKAPQEKGQSGQIEPAGYEVKCRVEKSRVCRPFRTATMRLDLDSLKFDRDFEIIKQAIHYGIIEQKGAWYFYGEDKFQGQKQLREQLVHGNDEFAAQVREKVMLALNR